MIDIYEIRGAYVVEGIKFEEILPHITMLLGRMIGSRHFSVDRVG
jgi:hypothetical protein